jgi:hypothetical protein
MIAPPVTTPALTYFAHCLDAISLKTYDKVDGIECCHSQTGLVKKRSVGQQSAGFWKEKG